MTVGLSTQTGNLKTSGLVSEIKAPELQCCAADRWMPVLFRHFNV